MLKLFVPLLLLLLLLLLSSEDCLLLFCFFFADELTFHWRYMHTSQQTTKSTARKSWVISYSSHSNRSSVLIYRWWVYILFYLILIGFRQSGRAGGRGSIFSPRLCTLACSARVPSLSAWPIRRRMMSAQTLCTINDFKKWDHSVSQQPNGLIGHAHWFYRQSLLCFCFLCLLFESSWN